MREVAQFRRSFNAHLARTRLENAGIRAWVHDEHTAVNTWHARFLPGHGIKLCVAPEDAERAAMLLYGPRKERVFTCAKCSATEVDAAKLATGFGIVLAALHLRWRKCVCRKCGHRWRGK